MNSVRPKDFPYPAPEVITDPYAFYAAMREGEPVYREPHTGVYFISRYEDVMFAAQRPDLFSSRRRGAVVSADPEIVEIRKAGFPDSISVTANDPPEHGRYRLLVARVLQPRRLMALEPKIKELANHLVDQFIEQGAVDFQTEYADRLPLTVIADLLDLDREIVPDMKKWSDDWSATIAAMAAPMTRERQLECAHSTNNMQLYFSKLLQERTAKPNDDIISTLIQVNAASPEPISHEEMVDTLRIFIIGGNDTTSSALGSLMSHLLKTPGNWARVVADPDNMIPVAIEEGLRTESPAQWLLRVTTQDTELGGTSIPAGSVCCLIWASANRDPRKFGPNAGKFDLNRGRSPHIAFGNGTHFCAGAPLARLELKISLEIITRRLKNLRLESPDEVLRFLVHPVTRRLNNLHVRFDPGQRGPSDEIGKAAAPMTIGASST